MKWVVVGFYVLSILHIHFRGRVRLPFRRQIFDHSSFMAPINIFMHKFSRVPNTPFTPLSEFPELARLQENGGGFDPASPDPDAHLDALAARLRHLDLCGRWRDEAIRVAHPAGWTRIERGCARVLGVPTLAVHLIGWHPDGRLWLQQRAASKAEDPNLWDTLVGGMVASHERPREALRRETWEEAGLDFDALADPRPGPRLHSRRPLPDGGGRGYLNERLLTLQATVPDGLQPRNQDGEVQAFALWHPADVRKGIAQGLFTLDAARLLLRVLP